MRHLLLSLLLLVLASTAKGQSITFEDLTLSHNIVRNGVKGMVAKATFVIHGMRGSKVSVGFAVTDGSGQVVIANNNIRFVYFQTLQCNYDDTRWSNVEQFFPYSIFPYVSGQTTYSLTFQAARADNTDFVLATSGGVDRKTVDFTYTPPKNNNTYTPYAPYAPQYGGNQVQSTFKCPVCRGTGQQEKYSSAALDQPNYYCGTCGRVVLAGHYHVFCTTCGGDGICGN